MKTLIARLLAHVSYHRELYLFGPLAALGLIGAVLFVSLLTGRDSTEDLGSLVATTVNLARVAMIAIAAGAIQSHFYGFRGKMQLAEGLPDLRDDVFDAIISTVLFAMLGFVVFFK